MRCIVYDSCAGWAKQGKSAHCYDQYVQLRVATCPGMSRFCPMLSRVPARPAPGRHMSLISR